MKKKTKDNIKLFFGITLVMILIVFVLIGPKPYWLPDGGMIWQ